MAIIQRVDQLEDESKLPNCIKRAEYKLRRSDGYTLWGDGVYFILRSFSRIKPFAANFGLFVQRETGIEQVIETIPEEPLGVIVATGQDKYIISPSDFEVCFPDSGASLRSSIGTGEMRVALVPRSPPRSEYSDILRKYFEMVNQKI